MTLDVTLCCVAHALTLVATQHDARIDSDFILVFPALCLCVWSQKKKKKKKKNWLITNYFRVF